MSPAQFAATYRSVADRVSAGTGIDPIALLSQWANETNWGAGWAGAPFNLANIEDGHGHVLKMSSYDEFVRICIATFHNGLYQPVLDATNAVDQLAAIVASPWSAGHYGGSLMGFYAQLEGFELTPQEHADLVNSAAVLGELFYVLGIQVTHNPDGSINFPATISTRLDRIEAEIKAIQTGPEPPEPKKGTIHLPAMDIPLDLNP